MATAKPLKLFRNLQLLDPRWDEPRGGHEVLIEGGLIKEVSDRPIKADGASVIDCGGKTLMPGLIDCHVHVYLSEVNIRALESVPISLLTARAIPLIRGMLMRGFTTVRDTGGADWGIKEGIEKGHILGPRLFIVGRAIGPTGGHSDARRRTDYFEKCRCCDGIVFTMTQADGVDAVRKAVREEMRQGADAIKIMASGGVASPYDPLDSRQFTLDEIGAAVEEAEAFGRYVLAHAYTPEAITRAVSKGVRTIEHGNLIDDASAKLLGQRGGFMIANLVTYQVMKERAKLFGMSDEMLEKNEMVREAGLRSIEICKRNGVEVGYGSDLLGELQAEQSREFLIRGELEKPIEVIRAATTIAARIVRQDGKLGIVEPGAHADLIVVDGNPLKNLGLFQDQGAHLSMIMKGGAFVKNRLV